MITVDSTDGFPDTGDIVCHSEVMGYARKSATTFEQLTRRKYDTVPVAKRRGWVLPLSTYMLDVQDKPRGYRDMKILKLLGGDESNPLVVQKQSDCYLVIARLPYPPHLRIVDGQVQLIPGDRSATGIGTLRVCPEHRSTQKKKTTFSKNLTTFSKKLTTF